MPSRLDKEKRPMLRTMFRGCTIALALLPVVLTGCSATPRGEAPREIRGAELKNLVERSYAYVALYNTLMGFALNDKNPFSTHGWNKTFKPTAGMDHTVRVIAAPNNDTLYVISALDLRAEPVVVSYPAFESNYVSLETSAFDHYCDVPLATNKGDFKKPTNILFYTRRSGGYSGQPVAGVDVIHELSGDFAAAFARVMPHANDSKRYARILGQIQEVRVQTLSEFQGKPAKAVEPAAFPAYGSDLKVFTTNFAEVMQFAVNHTTFDPANEMDRELLAALKQIGIEPGKSFDPAAPPAIDGAAMRPVVEEVAAWGKANTDKYAFDKFKSKGQMSLEAMVAQSVTGPVGQPASQAVYLNLFESADGQLLNALHDYVIRMTKDQLPPAQAFWSFTLFDAKDAFFIPNDRKKYSVGENAGLKLDASGGIAIHIAEKPPAGVPAENWLPISREDLPLRVQIRTYVPDIAKMKMWQTPKVERVANPRREK
jgi:hypothetical protein